MTVAAEDYARSCLVNLIKHVFEHRGGLIDGLTYRELAKRINRLNKHGLGHPRGMGALLGKMGHMLEGIEGSWGEPIPHLQSLVVLKSGPLKGLPDDGIKEFWCEYPQMTRTEKENKTQVEYKKIVGFGSRWNHVLRELGLAEVKDRADPIDLTSRMRRGSRGESDAHKMLKKFILRHPELVGAGPDWEGFIEYPLPSLDEVDVLFKSSDGCVAVEVKSTVSDSCPLDYERGIYQTIKYEALLKAMATCGRDIPSAIRSVLVLQSTLPNQFRKLAKLLGVTILENVG